MSDERHPLEPDAATFDAWTGTIVQFIRQHLLTLAEQPASAAADTAPLIDRIRRTPPEQGRPLDEILPRLGEAIARTINTAGPGYLAYIPGGGLYTAALAEYLAASVNRYVGVAATAPALVAIEQTAIRWLATAMGLPDSAGGVLLSGGSLANLTAVVTAREAHLGEDFTRGVIYASRETHASVTKAARIAGFTPHQIRLLPVDERRRLIPEALESAIHADQSRGLRPFLVIANIGTTNTGAIDPLEPILTIARRHGLWVHADAAYGGFFRLTEEGRARMPGIEQCDSITLDPHKGLFLPYGTGCVLVRDQKMLAQAFRAGADYLRDVESKDDTINFSDISPELSRDFRGLRVWLPIQLHGLAAFREALHEKLVLARRAWEALKDDDRFEILDEPQLSIVAFRLRGVGDEGNTELLRRVNGRRRVFLSSTVLDGRVTLRICVLSFRTHQGRVEEAVVGLREEAGRVLGSSGAD